MTAVFPNREGVVILGFFKHRYFTFVQTGF